MRDGQPQPEFYDHEKALAAAEDAIGADQEDETTLPRRERVLHRANPEDYLLLWDQRFRDQEDHMRKLWEMYTVMHRRFRGVTVSDQFGYWGTRPETAGAWIDFDPDQDGDVHPINIVRPDIKANVAALLEVNVAIDIESNNQDAGTQANAERLQKLADFFERDTWNDTDRTILFDCVHKEGTVLVETYLDRSRGCDQHVMTPVQQIQHYGVFECPRTECGFQGVTPLAADQAATGAEVILQCPECQAKGPGTVKQTTNYDLAEKQYRTGEITHRFWGGFNFIIDRNGARKRGIQTACYLQTMELVERAEIEERYPQFDFSAPFQWSFGLRCQHALANADWTLLYSDWRTSRGANEWDIFQKNTQFLHESAYRNYISPQDWEFRDYRGKCKFKIKRGQSWSDAVENSMGKGVKGFRYVMINERLIDIETPPEFEPNFRKCFSDVHFLRDSGSYHSVPHWDSVQLQDDITLFNTLKTETAARNSVRPVWFNSEVFDIHDFQRDYIPSKDGATDLETDITKAVFPTPVAEAHNDITEHLQFLLAYRREVSGVQPALLGEAQPDQPYAAQRQQLDRAFGLLKPASTSYAQMKVETTRQKIAAAFEHWTLEQFQEVSSRFGEVWTEQDVASLTSVDLMRDVTIGYVPGTEQPQGNLTKELKFFNGLREVLPLLQSGAVGPDAIVQILKRVDEFSDFDFDLTGLEVADALAQKRYHMLAEACAEYRGLTQRDIDEYKQKVVAVEHQVDPLTQAEIPVPISAFDAVTEEIMFEADLYISPTENVQTQINFFAPEIGRELAKPQPNYVLVEMMQILVDQFNGILAEAQAAAMENDPERVAAEEEAARSSEEGEKTHEREREAAGEDHDRELEKIAYAEASKENDREFQRETAARELMAAESATKKPAAKPKGK